ncbi:hypothetical protein FPQ18DRAFT_6260 [Pyronema domesticum]|uniref:Similar to SET domain-containing protein C1709.13c acc. no. O74738 n=1 Tax=Pyronema omphalodes (strain CBS 100304) TaxID=1076935 RepID=U4LA51_PYROM|nr:hypothetical protein FPQ18DRAFT_6260 [Pyronema domesticum]CCX10593.1 Similar to SET domain-containing protein C1709.13c; acc. no. O74738 [Pyronema omphalodes CBS 100304]
MSLQQSEEAWASYQTWITQNGGFIHKSITFSSNTSGAGAGGFATATIPAGTTLLTCPYTMVMDYGKAKKEFPEAFITAVDSHAALCFFVSKEVLKGEKSFWAPYLSVLPKEFNTPLYFSEEDKQYLIGTNLAGNEVEQRRAAWKAEWESGLEALKKLRESTEGYTWELFLWASTVFTSRSFPEKLTHWDEKPAEGIRTYDEETTAALFPAVDSLNHKPHTAITWQPTADRLSLISGQQVEAGEEIFNNYGPKANEELLNGYGFTIPNNPTDTVTIKFNAPLTPEQDALRSQQTQPARPGIYHLRAYNNRAFPTDLTGLFHILTASPSELPKLEANPSADIISIRNEMSTMFQLFMAVSQKRMAYGPELGQPQNDRQRCAAILREGQIGILEYFIQYSGSQLKKLWDENIGEKAFTLETVLTDEQFANAVLACFETRDIEEIIEAEQDDIVFVLYLCWKYLTSEEPKWRDWFKAMEQHYPLPEEDEEVDEGIEEVFDAIFPEAGEAAPNIFGGDKWNASVVEWVMGIYQSEGFNIILEGEPMYLISIEV